MTAGLQEQTAGRVRFDSFRGLETNVDAHDVGINGCVAMNNITTIIAGEMVVRKGHGTVTFSDSTPSPTKDIIAVYRFKPVRGDFIIVQVDGGGALDGIIRARSDPT